MDDAGRLERLLSPVGPGAGDRPRSVRDWVVDALVVLASAVVGGLVLVSAIVDGLGGPLLVVDVVAGALTLLSLWWRRRLPVVLLLIVLAISPFSALSAGAVLSLLFTVAVHRPPAVAIGFGVVSLVPLPLFWWLHPPSDSPWIDAGFGVAVSAIAVAWGMFVRARRQLVLSLAERARDAEAGQHARVERARLDERARIAREMHDVLAHRLSLLSLHAGALEFRPDASPEEVTRTAGVIRAAAHDALSELRGVIGVLRSDGAPEPAGTPEPPQPTLVDLDALLGECRAAGVRVDAAVSVDVAAVPAVLGRNAFRIVQEGLTNARKHAPGARVEVELAGTAGEELRIQIRNPVGVAVGAGAGMPGAGTGLVGLTERAVLAGGTLEHGLAGGAFRLRARLPWPA